MYFDQLMEFMKPLNLPEIYGEELDFSVPLEKEEIMKRASSLFGF